ncbi:MAG: serine/threonine-protein kinase [Deltaproteobacteria bacterium]|nr:serine/threonine-protein kinase [Deltaproteobacteria bacterium]
MTNSEHATPTSEASNAPSFGSRGQSAGLAASAANLPSLIGRVVGGRYRITRELASGGMGALFVAVQESLQREVALKVIKPGLVNERFRQRFDAEARAMSRCSHPNIVTLHDFGVDGDLPWLVLEKLDGRSLHEELESRGRMQWVRGVRVLRQIANALGEAHACHVVHRDLKPRNLFLVDRRTETDLVKVLDFGIAKILDKEASRVKTTIGVVLGTSGYIAPERLVGADVDGRSDLYALGAIAWDVLAGRAPFEAPNRIMLSLLHMTQPAPSLRSVVDVPVELDALVSALLEKDPAKRPARAADVAHQLDDILRVAARLDARG